LVAAVESFNIEKTADWLPAAGRQRLACRQRKNNTAACYPVFAIDQWMRLARWYNKCWSAYISKTGL